jgi:chemotaxis family two-component system response regulator Rcp1
VEDSKADVFLIRESLSAARVDADIRVLSDGEKAIRHFAQLDDDPSAACPDIVILDINLPIRKGREVLLQIRQSHRCAKTPVLVVTSSDSARDREEMGTLEVKEYFRKPSGYDEFMKLGGIVRRLLEDKPGSSVIQ